MAVFRVFLPCVWAAMILCVSAEGAFARQCVQDAQGGQCVSFVRQALGGDRAKMPGLCMFSKDCGAYWVWDKWDLGHGRGAEPRPGSILVVARSLRQPFGHVAVVRKVSEGKDGLLLLSVDESNWNLDEKMDCGTEYLFDPIAMKVHRGPKAMHVLGFVYGPLPGE